VVAASWVWSPEYTIANRALRAVANGWTITGFHRIQSGSPLVFTMGTDVAQNGILQPNGQYALLKSGMTADDVRRDHSDTADMLAAYFNTAAFVPLADVPRGIYGDAQRGLIYGPGDVNTDLAILRHLNVGGGARLQLRAEMFNLFNKANFSNPNTNLSSGTSFGRITGAGAGRVIQLAAKVVW
jgi:hypothetical protein